MLKQINEDMVNKTVDENINYQENKKINYDLSYKKSFDQYFDLKSSVKGQNQLDSNLNLNDQKDKNYLNQSKNAPLNNLEGNDQSFNPSFISTNQLINENINNEFTKNNKINEIKSNNDYLGNNLSKSKIKENETLSKVNQKLESLSLLIKANDQNRFYFYKNESGVELSLSLNTKETKTNKIILNQIKQLIKSEKLDVKAIYLNGENITGNFNQTNFTKLNEVTYGC